MKNRLDFCYLFLKALRLVFFLILLLDLWRTELEQVSFSTLVGDAQKGMFCSSL